MQRASFESLILTELSDLSEEVIPRESDLFRIGLLIPMCGSAGIWAPSCISCAQVAVSELNRLEGIAGRMVQLIMIDAAIETSLPIEHVVNDLIETRAIDAIVGMHISAMRQRLSKVVRQRVPYIYTPLYEGGETTAGIYAIGDTPDRQLGPPLEALQDLYRPASWALVGNDYVWPRSFNSFAKERLRALGVPLAMEEYLPFGAVDMERVIERIEASRAGAVLISLVGQDAVAFNRAFGRAGLHSRMIRLSCAIEENGLLACGAANMHRLFSISSYFGTLRTEANAAFKEKYLGLHGDRAPVLNTIGQSTYEGVHFLAGLLARDPVRWRRGRFDLRQPVPRRSVRRQDGSVEGQSPVYLARADGLTFEVMTL